tara:strand:- start:1111 stop:2634 length:1524 start_codon:yes stop_codon:yes gene_type:complete
MTEELTKEEQALELIKCKESPFYFLKYCKIVEPPTATSSGGVIDFTLWPHIGWILGRLHKGNNLVLLKSRQVGASYAIMLYVLWSMYKGGSLWLLFSRGETEVIELLAKARRIYQHLPEFLKLEITHSPEKELRFSNYSAIKAFAATEAGGISFHASGIFSDEWDYHPYAARNFLNAKPAMEDGGQYIGVSTVNILEPNTLAKSIYRQAQDGINEFTPLFIPYNVRPGRDEKWYDWKRQNIPEEEIGGLTPELYMAQNYPRSIQEAFTVPSTTRAFDPEALAEMKLNTRLPMSKEWYKETDLDRNVVNIYKPFAVGNVYLAASDVGHGVGRDSSVTGVMNAKTLEVVADIMSSSLSVDEFAYHSVKLLNHYKNPKWFPEDNEWGHSVILSAQKMGYDNFGYQDKARTKPGWHTQERSRYDLWGALIPAINNNQVTIYNPDGVNQFYDVIRNMENRGRIEAMSGRHDDYPMMVGICLAKKDSVDIGEWKPKTIQTLHWRKREKIQTIR